MNRIRIVVVLFSLIVISSAIVFVIEGFGSNTYNYNNIGKLFEKYSSVTYEAKVVVLENVEPVTSRTTSPEKLALTYWMPLTGADKGPLFKATFMVAQDSREIVHFNLFSDGLEIRLENLERDANGLMLFNVSVKFVNAVVVFPSNGWFVEKYLTKKFSIPVAELAVTSKDGRFKMVPIGEFILSKVVVLDPLAGLLAAREGKQATISKNQWFGLWPYTLPACGDSVVVYAVKPSLFDEEGFVGLANVVVVKDGVGRPAFSIFNPMRDQDVSQAVRMFKEMYRQIALEPDRFEPVVVTDWGRYLVIPLDVYEYRYNSEGLLVSAYPLLANQTQHGMVVGQEVSNLLIPTVVLEDFYYAVITPFSKKALLALELKEVH